MINKKFKANRPKVTKDTNIKPYWRVIKEIVERSTIIIEVLDARMPKISRNEEIEKIIKEYNKELIFLLNKADLVTQKDAYKKQNKLKKIAPTFIVSGKTRKGIKELREYLTIKSKQLPDTRIGFLGYPNTGKSSIINAIAYKRKAKVSAQAGTTHGAQWINAGKNLSVIDSPGVIPVKKNDEIRLALIGSRNPEKLREKELVAYKILSLFEDKEQLEVLYKIEIKSEDPEEILEQIGRKKGFIKKGNQIDEVRTSEQIIRDWQKGNLNFRE